MRRDEVILEDILIKIPKVRLKLNKKYFGNLLKKISPNVAPHRNRQLVEALNLKINKKGTSGTFYGWIKKERAIPYKIIGMILDLAGTDSKELANNTDFLKFGWSDFNLPNVFPIKIDRRLGSIVGHILGDGSIDRKYQQVFFSNSSKELLKEFETYMRVIFSVNPRIWMQKKPNFGNTEWDRRLTNIDELITGRNGALFYPTACGLVLNSIFEEFAIGKNKKLTSNILNANIDFKIGLIRAFYDDEATVTHKSIRLFQDRDDILEHFRDMLKEFGIIPCEIKTYIKRDKKRFYFDIFRKSNLRRFEEKIGFSSPDKKKKLNLITSRKPHGNDQ